MVNRRNFLLNFFLWVLSFIFGYRIGGMTKVDSNLISSLDARSDSEEIKILKEAIANKDNYFNVMNPQFNVRTDGKDTTLALREVINYCKLNNKIPYFPKGTYTVAPDLWRTGIRSDRYWACLDIPSDITLHFEKGAILQLIVNAPAWTRVLVISSSNVSITGEVEIDGQCRTVTNGNEHMAGLFIFNAKNLYIQSVYSHDCYGDNVFIGGTEQSYSDNVVIDYVNGVKAGRKNLVIHYVDKLHIKTALLDNSQGGASDGWIGDHSLDLEPDAFKGTRKFHQKIDYLSTYGTGNDFTVGITQELARMWVLEVGTFNVKRIRTELTGKSVILSYGLTAKIDNLNIVQDENETAVGLDLKYSAMWEIRNLSIEGGLDYAIRINSANGNVPSLKANSIEINRPNGKGLDIESAYVNIGVLKANKLKDLLLDVFAINSNFAVTIDSIISIDSCSSYIVNLSGSAGQVPYVFIYNIFVTDSRTVKPAAIINCWTTGAVNGLTLGSIRNPDSIKELNFSANINTKYLKIAGGSLLPSFFICYGTPEGIISAPVGSQAMRADGGVGTSMYVKENGTGNTGWVAK